MRRGTLYLTMRKMRAAIWPHFMCARDAPTPQSAHEEIDGGEDLWRKHGVRVVQRNDETAPASPPICGHTHGLSCVAGCFSGTE